MQKTALESQEETREGGEKVFLLLIRLFPTWLAQLLQDQDDSLNAIMENTSPIKLSNMDLAPPTPGFKIQK